MIDRKGMWLLGLVLALVLVGCGPKEVHIGIVTKLEHISPTWDIGVDTGRSARPGGPMVIPVQYPNQYIVTVEVCGLEKLYSIGSTVYDGIEMGDTVECTYSGSVVLCDFGEE